MLVLYRGPNQSISQLAKADLNHKGGRKINFDRYVPTYVPDSMAINLPTASFSLYKEGDVTRRGRPISIKFDGDLAQICMTMGALPWIREAFPTCPIHVHVIAKYQSLFPSYVSFTSYNAQDPSQYYRTFSFRFKDCKEHLQPINMRKNEIPDEMLDGYTKLYEREFTGPYIKGGLPAELGVLWSNGLAAETHYPGYDISPWPWIKTSGKHICVVGNGDSLALTWVNLGEILASRLDFDNHIVKYVSEFNPAQWNSQSRDVLDSWLFISCGHTPLNYLAAYAGIPSRCHYVNGGSGVDVEVSQLEALPQYSPALIGHDADLTEVAEMIAELATDIQGLHAEPAHEPEPEPTDGGGEEVDAWERE